MDYYLISYENRYNPKKMVISELTEYAAKQRFWQKFPGMYVHDVKKIDKSNLSYSQRSKLEESAQVGADFLDGVVTASLIDSVLDSISTGSSGFSEVVSDVVSGLGDAASSVASSFDGGGISDLFD